MSSKHSRRASLVFAPAALVVLGCVVAIGCGSESEEAAGDAPAEAPVVASTDPEVEPADPADDSAAYGEAGDNPDTNVDDMEPNDVEPPELVDVCSTQCVGLAPLATPKANRRKIQSCLSQCALTTLKAGAVFELAQSITVPSGATLTTADATPTSKWAELREVADTAGTPPSNRFGSSRLVTVCSKTDSAGCDTGAKNVGGKLRFLKLNLDNKHKASKGNLALYLEGANNLAEYVDIGNPVLASTIPRCGATFGPVIPVFGTMFYRTKVDGQYVPSHDNTLRHSKIHGTSMGVFFHQVLPKGSNNVVDDVEISMVRANPVTFGGFGKLTNSHLHDNGWCVGDGLNGGAVYCARDHIGGEITNNDIHDACRDVIDFDDCWGFSFIGNHLYKPGTRTFPAPVGAAPQCNASQAMRLGVPHDDIVKNNVIENKDRPWNTVGRQFGPREDRFSARGAAPYSDLPNGASQSLAMLLVRRPDQLTLTAQGNSFTGNSFVANCNSPGCVGMGYFTMRSTGLDAAGRWSAATTNTFRENKVIGSTLTSRRCGANWFAGGTARCVDGATTNGCNSDDAKHEGASHGANHSDYRNCGCRTY